MRDENAKSNERDMNVDPEEQTGDRNRHEQNDEPVNHEPLKIDEQDEKVSAMKENILRKFETAKETPIGHRIPIPKIKSDRHSKSAIETANKAINQIEDELPEVLSSLTDINHLVYAAASAITELLGIKQKRRNILRKVNQPKWKKRIENDLCKIRGDISILNKVKNEKPVREKRKKALFRKHNIKQKKTNTNSHRRTEITITSKSSTSKKVQKETKVFPPEQNF